jgi:metal-responsive CopG/Arc/MetJ family transcriptional regulator
VKIPSELASKLDALVSDMGYRSRAEIVNDAIRRFIDERKVLDSSRVNMMNSSEKLDEEPRSPSRMKREVLVSH